MALPGEGPDTFNMPTDTLVVANGDLFVTDGYGNHRVVKFNKDGKFLKTWGTLGTAPGQFRIPHSIVQDSRGRLIVSDRCGLSNTPCTGTRIQIFDTDGKFLDQWTYMAGDERYPFASRCSLYITKNDTLYVEMSDRIYIANALTGKMLDVIEDMGPNHGIAVDQSGDVYIAGLDRGGVRRYSRRTPRSGEQCTSCLRQFPQRCWCVVGLAVGFPGARPFVSKGRAFEVADFDARRGNAFALRCHPEPIRAKRGWVRDLFLLFSSSWM